MIALLAREKCKPKTIRLGKFCMPGMYAVHFWSIAHVAARITNYIYFSKTVNWELSHQYVLQESPKFAHHWHRRIQD